MRDPEMLRFLGVDVPKRFTIVFGIGALLAGLAGVVGGQITGVTPEVGMAVLVPSFLVVVIGGMGSLWGAVLAGLILGEAISLSVLIYPPMTQVIKIGRAPSELQSLMRTSYAVFFLKKKKKTKT